MDNPSALTIKELSGDGRELVLKGRALPYKGVSFKGKMRAEFTWYPGNAVASVQMLGPSEEPTSLRGTWKDRFLRSTTDEGVSVIPTALALLNGQQLEDVMDLVVVMDSIRRSGQLLKVTWDEVVREGVLTMFSPTWQRRAVVDWEAEFTWISQGEKQSPVSFAKTTDAGTFATKLALQVQALREAMLPKFELVDAFKKDLSSYFTTIEEASDQLSSMASDAVELIFTPQETALRALAAATSVKSSAQDIVNRIDSTPTRAVRKTAAGVQLALGENMAVDDWCRGVTRQAKSIRALTSEQMSTLSSTVRQEQLLATFVARAPMDLRTISTMFYDTPDEWRRLLQFNNFDSSLVELGQLVLIPVLDQAARGT